MIVRKDQSVFSNDILTQQSQVLYDDTVLAHDGSFIVSNFNGVKESLVIHTDYDSIYIRPNKSINIKNILTGKIESTIAEDVYELDRLVYKKRFHKFTGNNEHTFNEYIYLKNTDYSIAEYELLYKYNLPKNFLLKALSAGCPDKEYTRAKEYNTKLESIIKSLGLNNEEELRDHIIQANTSKVPKIKICYRFLDLFLYCVLGSYSLRSGTKVSLKGLADIPLSNITSYLDSLNIRYEGNDEYITIDSQLIFSLFSSEFNNCSFILNLSKLFVHYIEDKLLILDVIYMNNNKSLLYLQEFLYRSDSLSTLINNYLVKLEDYQQTSDSFLVEVKSVRPVENCSEFKEIT